MKKLAIYYRSNETEQNQDNQIRIEELHKLAKNLTNDGQAIEQFFEFETSALANERPQLDKLTHEIKNGTIDKIVTLGMDRFSRKLDKVLSILETLRENKVALYFSKSGSSPVSLNPLTKEFTSGANS